MNRKCPVCGEETFDGFRFCMNCGAEIAGDAAEKAADIVETAVSGAVSEASDVAETVEEAVTKAAEETADTVADTIETLNEPVVEAADSVVTLNETVSEAADPVVTLNETVSEAADPVVTLNETVSEAVDSVGTLNDPILQTSDSASDLSAPVLTDPVVSVPEPDVTIAEEKPEAAAPAPETPAEPEPVTPVVPVPVPVKQPEPVSVAPTYGEGVYGGATVAVFTPNTPEPAQQTNTQQYQQTYTQQYQQPYEQQYTPYGAGYNGAAYAPVKQVKEEKQKLGIGRRFLACFLCIFLFLSIFVSIIVFGMQKALSVDNLSEAVLDSETISKVNVGDLTGRKEDDGKSIAQYVIEQIPEEQRALYPELTEENLNELLSDEDVQKLLTSTLGDFVGYLTGDSDELMIDSDKVIEILEDNADTIEKYTGKKMKEEDFDSIRKEIENFNEEAVTKTPDKSGEQFAFGMKMLKFLFSDTMLYIAFGVAGFFALMIFLACGRFVDSSLLHIGVTGSLVGGMVFGGVRMGGTLIEKFAKNQIGETYIRIIRKVLLGHFEKAGLFVLCAGIGIVILGVVWKIIRFSMSE